MKKKKKTLKMPKFSQGQVDKGANTMFACLSGFLAIQERTDG